MPVKGSHKYVREEELNINISIFPILKYLILLLIYSMIQIDRKNRNPIYI